MKVFQREHSLRTKGRPRDPGHHRRSEGMRCRERRERRHRLRLLPAHDLLRAGQRIRAGFLKDFVRMLRRIVPSEKYYAHDDWDQAHREHLPRGCRVVRTAIRTAWRCCSAPRASPFRCATASSASAPGSASSSWSSTAPESDAGSCKSSATSCSGRRRLLPGKARLRPPPDDARGRRRRSQSLAVPLVLSRACSLVSLASAAPEPLVQRLDQNETGPPPAPFRWKSLRAAPAASGPDPVFRSPPTTLSHKPSTVPPPRELTHSPVRG